jgi:hypothetical protein
MNKLLTHVALIAALITAPAAFAKLPAPNPTPEAKAKAAEAAARTKWSNDVANFQTCRAMDRVVAQYRQQAQAAGKAASAPTPTQPCTDPGPFAFTPPSQKPIEASGPQNQSQPTGKKP